VIEAVTNNANETISLGRRIGSLLKPGDVLAISGELGAGKTTFINGVAAGLGISDFVSSPSFVIIKEHFGNIPLYHIDLYRLEEGMDIELLGIGEYFGKGGVVAIEWAEKMGDLLPDNYIEIEFVPIDENKRKITIDDRGSNRILKELIGG
jgi:tRNA threonylcarbamoyladenosine biosynthesis protein TsaE